jgi:hypothetical protein
MTLEDGRRHLFWDKDYQLQWEWASEQKTVPCELPATSDPSLINFAVSLSTTIPPDPIGDARPTLSIARSTNGSFTITGESQTGGALMVEVALNLTEPITWTPVQTNTVAAGAFDFSIAPGEVQNAYFRVVQID